MQGLHRPQYSRSHRATRRLGSASAQAALRTRGTTASIQIKDKDEIVRSFVEKIGESANQLKKLKNFEQNIKNLLIPYLIFYLNYPQLEVLLNPFRSKNLPPRKSQKSRIIWMTRIAGTSSWNMWLRWLMTMTTRITESWLCNSSVVWANASVRVFASSLSVWSCFL